MRIIQGLSGTLDLLQDVSCLGGPNEWLGSFRFCARLAPDTVWLRRGAVRVAPAREERRKSGRVKPDINNVHYWLAVMIPWEGVYAWSFEAPFGEGASNGNERRSARAA